MTFVTVVAKAFWKSKTILANVLLALPPILDALTNAQLPFTREQWYIGLVIVVNVLLRFVTSGPIAATDTMVQVKQNPTIAG